MEIIELYEKVCLLLDLIDFQIFTIESSFPLEIGLHEIWIEITALIQFE